MTTSQALGGMARWLPGAGMFTQALELQVSTPRLHMQHWTHQNLVWDSWVLL